MTDKTTLHLWNEFKETPPAVTKAFTKGGGFKGKSIDPMYIIRRLTEKFGPNGTGWGFEILDEAYINGVQFSNEYEDRKGEKFTTTYEGHTIIHKIRLHIWYMDGEEKKFTSPQFGLTTFVGEYKSGPFTDEDHAKKSVTDAIGKCAVLLGLAADVHMGLHDDNKYVNDLRAKLNEKAGTPAKEKTQQEKDNVRLVISEAQRKRLFAISKEQHWAESAVKSLIAEHGFDSSKKITKIAYKEIIERIESMDMKRG